MLPSTQMSCRSGSYRYLAPTSCSFRTGTGGIARIDSASWTTDSSCDASKELDGVRCEKKLCGAPLRTAKQRIQQEALPLTATRESSGSSMMNTVATSLAKITWDSEQQISPLHPMKETSAKGRNHLPRLFAIHAREMSNSTCLSL